jgi:hypothetical protein
MLGADPFGAMTLQRPLHSRHFVKIPPDMSVVIFCTHHILGRKDEKKILGSSWNILMVDFLTDALLIKYASCNTSLDFKFLLNEILRQGSVHDLHIKSFIYDNLNALALSRPYAGVCYRAVPSMHNFIQLAEFYSASQDEKNASSGPYSQ